MAKFCHARFIHRKFSKLLSPGLKEQKERFVKSQCAAQHSSENQIRVHRKDDFNPEPAREAIPEDSALEYEDYFGVKGMVKLHELFASRVHFGHKAGCRNPHMTPYVFGSRFNIDIIDLEKTVPMLQQALNITAHIAYRQGIILFVSRNLQTMPNVESAAKECGEYAHCRFWKGGIFTNSKALFKTETRLPDLCIFINMLNSQFENHVGIAESDKLLIPTVGIVDTNCDPTIMAYPVPGNDDSPASVKLYCRLFKEAVLKGKEKRIQDKL